MKREKERERSPKEDVEGNYSLARSLKTNEFTYHLSRKKKLPSVLLLLLL